MRTAYNPKVFVKPSGLTETLFYRASLRIPFLALIGASGRNTDENIRVSTAAAGQLQMTRDPNTGYAEWTVGLTAYPKDR